VNKLQNDIKKLEAKENMNNNPFAIKTNKIKENTKVKPIGIAPNTIKNIQLSASKLAVATKG
jgi:hypothetical protein